MKYLDGIENLSPGRVALATACTLDRDPDQHMQLHATLHNTSVLPQDGCYGPLADASRLARELRSAARQTATPADVLLVAASEIRQRGRWVGGYRPTYWPEPDEVGTPADPARCPVCAVGAIAAVLCGEPADADFLLAADLLFRQTVAVLSEHLVPDDPVPPDDPGLAVANVARWSDAGERTVEQIAEAMEQAAAAYAGGEPR